MDRRTGTLPNPFAPLSNTLSNAGRSIAKPERRNLDVLAELVRNGLAKKRVMQSWTNLDNDCPTAGLLVTLFQRNWAANGWTINAQKTAKTLRQSGKVLADLVHKKRQINEEANTATSGKSDPTTPSMPPLDMYTPAHNFLVILECCVGA